MAFEKGKSGNPGGRPKENKEVQELAKQYTPMAIERLRYWAESDEPKASVAASTALLNRGWGTPAQSVTVSGDADKPIVIQHRIA